MNMQRSLTVLLVVAVFTLAAALLPRLYAHPTPGSNEGYEPRQPVDYSHRLHAGEMQIDCQYCHYGAKYSRHAGVPPASVCMNCHSLVTASLGAVRAENVKAEKAHRAPVRIVSPEIQKIYDYLGLNKELKRDPKKTPYPIAWKKVYDLPDFVIFDHRRHVNTGVECQSCHGAVESMERVRQVGNLSMGWCINCHRDNTGKVLNGRRMQPSNDCISCHY